MFSDVLRSRVGRQIFALSSLIASVPLAIVGTLSLLEVNRNFTKRSDEFLRNSARAYGQVVYERLLLASELVRQTALTTGDVADHPSEQLESVEIVDRKGPADIARRTLYFDTATVPAKVYLMRRIGERTAVGLVSSEYLWGDAEDQPYAINFCVLATGIAQPVHCPGATAETALDALRAMPGVSGSLSWEDSGTKLSSAYWELFTHSVFDGPLLRFVATQPETIAFGSWAAFRALYAPALLLVIGIVLFVAGMHARRTLRPIQALLGATRRIAAGDLAARANVRGRDEFTDLADSMNRMAAGLERQFDTLRMLAQVDRLILSGADMNQLAQRILQHLAGILPCEALGIVLAEPDAPEAARAHVVGPERGEVRTMRRTLPPRALAGLAAHRHGKTVADPAADAIGSALAGASVRRVLLIPLMARERVGGALMIGLGAGPVLDDAQLHTVRDFTGRLSVALEAAERENELLRRAYFDELTGLPNRQLLLDRLEQALIQARNSSERLLVLFVDLDRFKTVNDSFGHGPGDALLQEAAARLRASVGDSVTVARLGGDEFVLLLPRPQGNEGDSAPVIDRLLAEMSRPFNAGNSEVFLSASIGVAAYPGDGATADELLRKADTAMYGAKDAGRGQAVYYSADMSRRVRQKLDTEAQLRHALERDEFRLAYQPQRCLRSRRIVAAEALLRWRHPGLGDVSPNEFIPIAEETGYITILGAWAMHQACAQLVRWQGAGTALEQVAVNVSVRQFRKAGFAAQVEECLSRTGLAPRSLLLELTESIFVSDPQHARQVIGQLKEIGVSIAIDDFGTGYSSLSYLKQLAFDQIKIDRAFVKDLPDDRDGNAIVHAVVAMSHTLGKPVIAEGIETQRQFDHLRDVGVDLGQGMLLGAPAFAEDFTLEMEPAGALQQAAGGRKA